jgi:hypothetical protein
VFTRSSGRWNGGDLQNFASKLRRPYQLQNDCVLEIEILRQAREYSSLELWLGSYAPKHVGPESGILLNSADDALNRFCVLE